MTSEKWQQIKDTITKQFTVEEQGKEDLLVETGEGLVKQGIAEYIIFTAGGGSAFGGERLKLQFGQKPKVEEKKYFYSHRSGDAARVEYKFSDDELVNTFKAYKWSEGDDDWKEIDADKFNL